MTKFIEIEKDLFIAADDIKSIERAKFTTANPEHSTFIIELSNRTYHVEVAKELSIGDFIHHLSSELEGCYNYVYLARFYKYVCGFNDIDVDKNEIKVATFVDPSNYGITNDNNELIW